MYGLDGAVAAPARLRAGLGLLFWGLLLSALDFRYNGIDVLPDVLGWALMVVGSGRLMGQANESAYEFRAAVAWVISIAAALLAIGDTVALPTALALPYLLLNVMHPIVVAATMHRLATVAGAEAERRSWEVSLWALGLSAVIMATTLAIFATGGSDTAPVAVVITLLAIAALLHYLVSLQRSRKALGTHDAGGRMLGATPGDVSRGVT